MELEEAFSVIFCSAWCNDRSSSGGGKGTTLYQEEALLLLYQRRCIDFVFDGLVAARFTASWKSFSFCKDWRSSSRHQHR